jgi:hypothetical protein
MKKKKAINYLKKMNFHRYFLFLLKFFKKNKYINQKLKKNNIQNKKRKK